MKTIVTLFALVVLAAVICSLACRCLRAALPEPSPIAAEMEQAYGDNWAERLIAARTTNRELHVEMVRAYYEAVDANTEELAQLPNWVGHRYLGSNQRLLTRTR